MTTDTVTVSLEEGFTHNELYSNLGLQIFDFFTTRFFTICNLAHERTNLPINHPLAALQVLLSGGRKMEGWSKLLENKRRQSFLNSAYWPNRYKQQITIKYYQKTYWKFIRFHSAQKHSNLAEFCFTKRFNSNSVSARKPSAFVAILYEIIIVNIWNKNFKITTYYNLKVKVVNKFLFTFNIHRILLYSSDSFEHTHFKLWHTDFKH